MPLGKPKQPSGEPKPKGNGYPPESALARIHSLHLKTKLLKGHIRDRVFLIGLNAVEKNPELLTP